MTRKIGGCRCGCNIWRIVQEDNKEVELQCYACGIINDTIKIMEEK